MTAQTYEPNSSNIRAVGYDDETRELRVTFLNGATYSYSAVPPETFEGLKSSPSVGSYFHHQVKPRHAGRRV